MIEHVQPVPTVADPPRGRRHENAIVVVLGIIAGMLGLALAGMETRWIVYLLGAVVIFPAIAFAPRRERLLTTLFFMSMQIDVYVRFMYGRAGTGGLALPLSIIVGSVLWWQIRSEDEKPDDYVWLGALRTPILACLGTTAVTMLFSEERFASLSRFLFELQIFFIYSLALNVVRREQGFTRPMQLLAVVLGIQATICIIQWRLGVNFSFLGEVTELGSVPRPGGTVSTNPAGFASFIMPIVMVLAARFGSRDARYRRKSDGIVVLLGIVAIVLTITRAAWAGLALGLGYMTIVGYRRRYITLKQITLIGAAAAVMFVCALPLMQTRMQETNNKDTYDERARLNAIAVGIIMEHPVFGLGPGAYDFRFKNYIGENWEQEHWVAGVHNEYLMRAAETGILGGLAWVWLLLAALRQARKLVATSTELSHRLFGLGWSAGLLALAWQMYWVPWRGFSYNAMFWLFLGIADGVAYLERQKAEALSNQRRSLAASAVPPPAHGSA